MKNSEVVSALVGGTFFAVPFLAVFGGTVGVVPIAASTAIGAAAYAASELVLKKEAIKDLKTTNFNLYKTLENAKKQVKELRGMIPNLESNYLKSVVSDICESVDKIIDTIERYPEKEKKLKNFFDYYLPVTLKLVNRYDEIENQRISSKESKKFYENTYNTLVEIEDVFKQFLNIIYEADMDDANVEIKVLNSMLKADGLDKKEMKVEEKKDEK